MPWTQARWLGRGFPKAACSCPLNMNFLLDFFIIKIFISFMKSMTYVFIRYSPHVLALPCL
jgi:hypothetical protein